MKKNYTTTQELREGEGRYHTLITNRGDKLRVEKLPIY
jgi:hypothetical protein